MRYAPEILRPPVRARTAASGRSAALLVAAPAAMSLLAVSLLSGCVGASGASSTVAPAESVIAITDSKCGTGWRHPTTGVQTLQIRNVANSPVEVALIDAYNGAVYARVEGVGPGTTRAMPVDVGSGAYAFTCDGPVYGDTTGPAIHIPGHVRGGIAILPVSQGDMIALIKEEEAYVSQGLATVARQTAELAAEIKAGDLSAAQATWLSAHMAWERLGSAYGMFGPYDGEIDGTPFGLPQGVDDPGFTGFYRLEYGLWHGQSPTELTGPAETLNLDVRSLETAYPGMQLLPPLALSDLALRTHEVLENAMQQQLSGQDNFGSGTTLATVAAGIDATKTQLSFLHPLLIGRYQNLSALYSWLDRLQSLVEAQKTSHGWTPVSSLTTEQQEMLDAAAGETVQLLALIPPLFEADPNS